MFKEHPRAVFAAAALWLLGIFLGVSFIRSAAATYDEPVHLASGYSYWQEGRYRLNISDHPPLAEMLSAVPLLFMKPQLNRTHPYWIQMRRYPFADDFLYNNSIPPGTLLNAGRTFSLIVLWTALAVMLFFWGMRLGGPAAGVASVGAGAFSPVLISNISLVTTDGLAAVLFFAAFFILSVRPLTRVRFAAGGICTGLALASKFSMIVLPAFILGLLLLEHGFLARPEAREGIVKKKGKKKKKEAERALPRFDWPGLGIAIVCAFAALAVVYRFGQLDLFFSGLRSTLSRLGGGRSSFLYGEYSLTGFALYFPIALLIKTPLPILGLGMATALAWGRRLQRDRLWVLLPAIAYFAVALTAKVQIGVRHLLPMIPLLALVAGCGVGALWSAGGKARGFAVMLALWTTISVGRNFPYQLAYFNEIAGGTSGGHHWLADSNLDWGQGLKGLADVLARKGNPPIYLSYFGVADPSAYGISYVSVIPNWNVKRWGDDVDPSASKRLYFAISATNLQAVYIRDRTTFYWLKRRRPIETIGGSIFLYDLTEDKEGRAALARILTMSGHPRSPSLVGPLLLQ
ncbi:MAG: hypothetical protein COB53_08295 [Elusimicrobia bacterium]|nr:MAG: hypothetical protein COB53_08295 [Elusimicrobiota bacterium]